jgi:hypothetical protein
VDISFLIQWLGKQRDDFNAKAGEAFDRMDKAKHPKVIDMLMARYEAVSSKADAFAGAIGVVAGVAATQIPGTELQSAAGLASAICIWAASETADQRAAMWSGVLGALEDVKNETKKAADDAERRRSAETDAAIEKAKSEVEAAKAVVEKAALDRRIAEETARAAAAKAASDRKIAEERAASDRRIAEENARTERSERTTLVFCSVA